MYTKKKNRTLAVSGQGAYFYVSLTGNPFLAAAEKRSGGTGIGLLATEIGPVATGILGVFPICTYQRCYMYIYRCGNVLIISIAIKMGNASAFPIFSLHKDNTFFSVSQIAINVLYKIGKGKIGHFLGGVRGFLCGYRYMGIIGFMDLPQLLGRVKWLLWIPLRRCLRVGRAESPKAHSPGQAKRHPG